MSEEKKTRKITKEPKVEKQNTSQASWVQILNVQKGLTPNGDKRV